MLEILLEEVSNDHLESKGYSGETPLISAACHVGIDNLSNLEYLIYRGANINAIDYFNDSALTKASWSSRNQLVSIDNSVIVTLVKNGANIDHRGRNLRTAVTNAAWVGSYDILHSLVDSGADLTIPDIDGDTALILSVEKFDCPVIEKLLEKGAVLEHRGSQGQTALLNACVKNKVKNVVCLVENGADISVSDNFNNTRWFFQISNSGGHNKFKVKKVMFGHFGVKLGHFRSCSRIYGEFCITSLYCSDSSEHFRVCRRYQVFVQAGLSMQY